MGSKIFLLAHAMLTVMLMALGECNGKKKPESYPAPFVLQQPIVTYRFIKEAEFTIQLGEEPATSLDNAFVLAGKLRAANVACFVEKSEAGDKYRVCVGRFQSRERAENMLKVLAQKKIRGGRIKEGPFK